MGPLGCEHGVKDRQSLFAAISEVGISRGREDRCAGDQSVVLRNSVVAQLGALAVIDCHGTKRFKYGVDADEGWMLGVLDVAGLGLVGYCKQVPVFPANRMRTVSSPRSSTRIASPTSRWGPTVHLCVCHPVGAMRSRNGKHCVM